MQNIEQWMKAIEPLDQQAIRKAEHHLDQLTKPPGSLGRLEEIAIQLAGITGKTVAEIHKKAVVVMAADHGVCEEGVSAFPQEVTGQMVLNFLNGGAAVNVLARHVQADVLCVDIGVKSEIEHPQLYMKKIKAGTDNMAVGPAMSKETAMQAIQVGVEMTSKLATEGYQLIATGEMGIGNTTASSAILSVFTGVDVEQTVGRGTGIDDKRWNHKQRVVRQAIEVNKPDRKDALDVLSKVGGLEIAGLAGVIIGAAMHRIPVVIDGFISSAAALTAARLIPQTTSYMIASHRSHEQGHQAMLEAIGLKPMLDMDMRLGEGTGAVLCFSMIEASTKIMKEMATFSSAGISDK